MRHESPWKTEPIGSIVQEKIETENPRIVYPDGEFLYVDISGIDHIQGAVREWKRLQGKNAPSRARQKIRQDDILVSTVRPNLNATALVPDFLDGQICSTGFCVLRSNGSVIPKYLYYFTRTSYFVESLSSMTRGASYPAVADRDVKGLQIPLPPAETQMRIVSILDRGQRLRRKRQEANQLTMKITQSLFLKMFGDPSRNLRNWKMAPLRELSTLITKGTTPTTYGHEYVGAGVPFLRAEDVNGGEIDLSRVSRMIDLETHELLKRSQLRGGDVLITIAGAIGRSGWVPLKPGLANINQAVALVRLKSDLALPEFVSHQLETSFVQSQVSSMQRGVAQKNLNLRQVGDIQIALPPVSDQRRFTAFVSKHMALAQMQKRSAEEISELLNSLMHKAFRGELVP